MAKGYIRTKDEIEEIANSFGYKLLEEYIEGKQRRVHIQDKIGYKYDVNLSNLISGYIPCFVSIENIKFTLENMSFWLYLNRPEFELYEENTYDGSYKKLNFYHINCNEYFEMNWNSISQGIGCPVCSGHQAGQRTSISYLRPDLAKEWHSNKNGTLTPNDKTCGSHTKVWWLCPKGHEYYSVITDRVKGQGCKQCSDEQKESKVATELKEYYKKKCGKDCDPEHPMFHSDKGGILRCDIYLGKPTSINGVYIEVHWDQHYKLSYFHKLLSKKKNTSSEEEFENQKYRDEIKKQYAKKHGTYIEIDLRKIKTIEEAIDYIENILGEKYEF